jgi:DNA-binding winged helix-turn-helix (wHTH) protein/tetratricopeptide (TPR) repeat protein
MDDTVRDALFTAIYAFDEFRLDVRRARLTRRDVEVTLTPKAFAVLECLVRNAGCLVDKRALFEAAWPDVVVEESNLSQTVYRLRRALGEQPSDHRFIVTVPGRGYRFVADVRRLPYESAVAGPLPSSTSARPVDARTGSGAWPSDVGASELSSAPRSAPPLARRPSRPWLLAAAAGVLVAIAVAGGAWKTRSLPTAAVAPQAPLAAAAAVGAATTRATATASPAAAEAAARARFLFARRAPGDLERARATYEDAIAASPGYAELWAGLAGVVWVQTGRDGVARPAGLERVRAAAQRAVDLDPGSVEGHVRLAIYYFCTGDERRAHEHLGLAARIDPDQPLLLSVLAGEAAERLRFDEAIELSRRAVRRDALNLSARVNLLAFLLAAGRVDEAEAEARRIVEIHPADGATMLLGEVHLARGDVAGAKRWFAQVNDETARQQSEALLEAVADRTDSDADLRRLVARVGSKDPFAVAEVYAVRGDPDRAFEWLERAAPSRGGSGRAPSSRPRWTMPSSPLLASLHADPRWAAWERAGATP